MESQEDEVVVRTLSPGDDLEALTRLIRSAYAVHADRGLRFWATHQSVEDTAKRFADGQGLVAELAGQVVGTITVRPPEVDASVAIFRDPFTWSIGQFAVSPDWRGQGIGRKLHQAAAAWALGRGARRMALDTAEPAVELIRLYQSWGYRVVGQCDWRPFTNYLSVVMVLELDGGDGTGRLVTDPEPSPPTA